MSGKYYKFSDEVKALSEMAMADIAGRFAEIDEIAQRNTEKVLPAFQRHHRLRLRR